MFKWFGIRNLSPCTRVAEFAEHLRGGRLMAARCRACGHTSFPPRADCARCLSPEFEWVAIGGACRLVTWSRVTAAPAGFEALAPYTVAVVDLDEGGRALAWIGNSVPESTLAIGIPLQLVPRLHEELEDIHVDYTLEAPEQAALRPSASLSYAGTPSAATRRPSP
jgi:uncharacterized OB-fold protein